MQDLKPGDWLCPSCQCHNFASRINCFRCNAPNMDMNMRYKSGPNGMGGMQGGGGQQGMMYANSQYPNLRMNQQRPGDWICPRPTCKFQNFASRYECMRCRYRRPGSGVNSGGNIPSGMMKQQNVDLPPTGGGISSRVLPGDWICSNCNLNNFASRTRCLHCSTPNMRVPRPADRPGDWDCPSEGCRYHNFASRTECYRCGTRKCATDQDEIPSMYTAYNTCSDVMDGGGSVENSASDFNRDSEENAPYNSGSKKVKLNDWICSDSSCGFYNISRRDTCANCGAPAQSVIEGPPGVSPESVNTNFSPFINYNKQLFQEHVPPSTSQPSLPNDLNTR